MPEPRKRLGIVGAGKIGTAIARAAVDAGYDVVVSGSGAVERIALTVQILAPGARAATAAEAVEHSDLVVLAVPTHRFRELAPDLFDGKIVVDAMNHWYPIDGDDPELTEDPEGSSMVVQRFFPGARVVKALNQLGYHEFDEHRRPAGGPGRVAVAAAGDDPAAVDRVLELIDHLGFDPVDAGPLRHGIVLGPDGSAFGIAYPAADLVNHLQLAPRDDLAPQP